MLNIRPIFALAVIACFSSCGGRSSLSPFSSDGCTLFPDESKITGTDWCECCFSHDIAYWKGGTSEQRKLADLKLKECVEATTGNSILANVMYEGVRKGGSPYFVNWYRWGYGWEYERKYKALSAEEEEMASELLKEYYKSGKKGVCAIKTVT